MQLCKILKGVRILEVKGNLEQDILYLSQKTEDCRESSLFFCIKGISGDGHDFVDVAIKNGAKALIVERFINKCNITQILVKNTRNIMPKICNNFYNNVLSKLKLIGITGTNGKTTTTKILQSIFLASNKKVGIIGTNGVEFTGKKFSSNLTTPDTTTLFKIFNDMADSGVKYVVMEVSAHAISLNKLKGIKFEVGLFTNLTQDHLDFFCSMHKYALTKLKFLQKTYCKNVVINIDDKYGALFQKLTNSNLFTFGINLPAQNFAIDIDLTFKGSSFLCSVIDSPLYITSNLPCLFNVYNVLGACVVAKILDLPIDCIVQGVNKIRNIDGRMNCFKLKNNAYAIIDFAHTPDGIKKVLEGLRGLVKGKKIITVFGCGGNRDRGKRRLMGEVASKLSDKVIVTSDNPRNENPETIIKDITYGIKGEFLCQIDRKKAIKHAFDLSSDGDVILIAGKGAENYQEINGVKLPYSDLDEIKNYI